VLACTASQHILTQVAASYPILDLQDKHFTIRDAVTAYLRSTVRKEKPSSNSKDDDDDNDDSPGDIESSLITIP
jgi:hypothetical protein